MQETDNINRNKLAILESDTGNLRKSLTDKDRDICELRNNLENDNKMLQQHYDKMTAQKNQELSNLISMNTDLKGQIEQLK